jgi:hypothetical protein
MNVVNQENVYLFLAHAVRWLKGLVMSSWTIFLAAASLSWLKMAYLSSRFVLLHNKCEQSYIHTDSTQFSGRIFNHQLTKFKVIALSTCVQFISIPEERYEEYRRSSDFIKEYIFPGGCLPSLARITSAMSAASRLWYDFLHIKFLNDRNSPLNSILSIS